MDIEDKGFILKKREYGDYDIFGTFYTSGLGKINLLINCSKLIFLFKKISIKLFLIKSTLIVFCNIALTEVMTIY